MSIVAQIVALHKDFAPGEVEEILAGKAMVSDLPAIRAELLDHVSSNETNAADIAISWIDANA